MSPRTRNGIFFAVKLALAAALITWLVRGGTLDFGKLRLLVERPSLLALSLAYFAIGVSVNGHRWRVLLRIAGVDISFTKMLQLQLTGLFFGVVIPGNVGGDVIKSLYVARDADKEKRTAIFLVAFADRFLGLAGLVAMAALVILVRGSAVWSDPMLSRTAAVVLLLAAGSLGGPALLLFLTNRAGPRLETWTSGSTRLARVLSQLVGALRLMAKQPLRLTWALVLSMTTHAAGIAWFTILTAAATGQDASYSTISTVYPLGILTIVLPISPAGMGVGHVAFERLFATIGLSGGATVFNIFILSQTAECLFGVVPYLSLKKSGELPTTEQPS